MKNMAKTANIIGFIIFSVASVIFCLALISGFVAANTLVGGKIYNSDFSEVIDGADVSVNCGGNILDTVSLSDGAYAVVFDSESCHLDSEVVVSATKGSLADEDSSSVYASEEEAGELVAVVNLHLHSTNTVNVGKRHGGTWFQCGNTVCDSGESYDTCPADCSKPVQEEIPAVVVTAETPGEGSGSGNSNPEETEQTGTDGTTGPGITGAVVGTDLSKSKFNLNMILVLLVLLLIIAIAVIASVADSREKRNKKLEAALAQVNLK
jgi:hypothetical protein